MAGCPEQGRQSPPRTLGVDIAIMKHFLASTLFAFICFSIPSIHAADTKETSTDGVYADCEACIKSLTDGVLALHQAKRTPSMTVLLLDLSSTLCTVELAVTSKDEIAPAKMHERFKRSVVMLGSIYKCGKCRQWHVNTASGFFISKSGAVVTSYHVVNHPDHVAMGAMTSDGRIHAVKKILAADKDSDVVIVQIDGSGFEPMALIDKTAVGSRVFVLSHPGRRPYTFSNGIVSGYFLIKDAGGRNKTKRMAITADYGVGSSGGPVMDDCGNVSGIVASTRPVMGGCESNHYAQMVFRDCVPAESILALTRK